MTSADQTKTLQELEQEVARVQNQNSILQEMNNLKDDSYYRLQKISLLTELVECFKAHDKKMEELK